jgi:hypothetical protein
MDSAPIDGDIALNNDATALTSALMHRSARTRNIGLPYSGPRPNRVLVLPHASHNSTKPL